ncbi:hypothetical protein KBD59_03160 [Candidatus Gracilibacteria bacterium]|nr:hypothetical protein [Candidatus Gracilibacteria bacterium]
MFRENKNTHRFIYRTTSPRGGASEGAVPPDEQDEEQKLRMNQLMEEDRRRSLQTKIGTSRASTATKLRMRDYLSAEDASKQNLVERFLNDENVNEATLLKEMNEIESLEDSWKVIGSIQRDVRGKIHELQWRVEGYADRLPHQRARFEAALKDIKALNRNDDIFDRGLKNELLALMKPAQNGDKTAVLNSAAVKAIYMLDPTSKDFEKQMKVYQPLIEKRTGGDAIFKRIIERKREEIIIERNFKKLTDTANNMISDNLSRVRRAADKKEILKNASSAVGVSIEEGTELEYERPDPTSIISVKSKHHVTIKNITIEEIPKYDNHGNRIGYVLGAPKIILDDGSSYTLGRFKKWVDAVDAVEAVHGMKEVQKKIGYGVYGSELEAGTMLSYMLHTRTKEGKILGTPTFVTVTEIKNGVIYFNMPVQFAPGMEGVDEFEMRESLTYGEFVKWWHRYEVEKAMSQQELREALFRYNQVQNKEYGTNTDSNPPIDLEAGEELRYPDDSGASFIIEKVDNNGVKLNNGRYMSFPEFFNWIKVNQVEKLPIKVRSRAEREEEENVRKGIKDKLEHEFTKVELKEDAAAKRWEGVYKERDEVQAQTPMKMLARMWHTTTFLSLADLWNVGKEIYEFVKRRHERRSKGRYAEALSKMPGLLGVEGERVKESAEHEEVNKYKEAMEHWGIPKIKKTMYETSDKDVSKACMLTLIHKGEMRWDDHFMWNTLNRLTSRYTLKGTMLYIPSPEKMPPGESGEDFCRKSIDALWGEGTAAEWYMDNTGKYNSHKKEFEWKFKQLENDPKGTGGPSAELRKMLQDWLKGEYVSPHEYEAILDGALKYGKMYTEDKVFFIFMGVMAREGNGHGHNPHGETLLHIDRLGELNSLYLNQFPLLDFYTQEVVYDPIIKKHRKLNLNDFMEMMEEYFPNDFRNCKASEEFNRFLWEKMLMSDSVRVRISKGLRNAENMDHDDAHLYIPPASATEIDQLTLPATGNKKYFSTPGFMNAYPGFAHYIKSLTYSIDEEDDDEKRGNKISSLAEGINSFIRFDLIMDSRYDKKSPARARLDEHHYRSPPVVDDVTVGFHQGQMRNLVMEIAKEYGRAQDFDFLYKDKTKSILDKDEERKQNEYEGKVQNLPQLVQAMIAEDKGAKAMQVIKRAISRGMDAANGLRGIPRADRPGRDKLIELRNHAREALVERQHAEEHGDAHH